MESTFAHLLELLARIEEASRNEYAFSLTKS